MNIRQPLSGSDPLRPVHFANIDVSLLRPTNYFWVCVILCEPKGAVKLPAVPYRYQGADSSFAVFHSTEQTSYKVEAGKNQTLQDSFGALNTAVW